MTVTIWHNSGCSTSRTVLAMIRASGIEPKIVEYLKTPPNAANLARVALAVGGAARLLRTKAAPELASAGDAQILAAMAADPALIERPVVISPKGVVVARPPETVRPLL